MSILDKIKDKAQEFGDKVSDKAKDLGLTEIAGGFKDKLKEGFGDVSESTAKVTDELAEGGEKMKNKIGEKIGKFGPFKALEKDAKLGRTLHSDVIAAMNILQEKHKDVKKLLKKAHGFAVVPSMGRASLVLGGAYGVGEVFEKEKVVGYAGIVKVDIGVQIGGTNFHEIVVFNDKKVWDQFKKGVYAFEAEAGVAIVKAGAQASRSFGAGTVVFVFNEGGELIDLSIGIQKFIFKKTVLGKARTTEGADAEYKETEKKKKKASEQRAAEKRDKKKDNEKKDKEKKEKD